MGQNPITEGKEAAATISLHVDIDSMERKSQGPDCCVISIGNYRLVGWGIWGRGGGMGGGV